MSFRNRRPQAENPTETMMYAALLIILLLASAPARASNPPCQAPAITEGWASTFSNIPTTVVSGFVYDLSTQIMFATMKSGLVNWFFKFPNSQASAWSNTRHPAPDQFYASSVSNSYHRGFLTEDCSKNFVTEDGKTYLWTR